MSSGEQVRVHRIARGERGHGLLQQAAKPLFNAAPSLGRFRGLSAAALLLLCGTLAACQSDVDGVARNVKTNDIKPPSTEVEESYGETGAEITLLLPKSGSGLYEGAARDVRDGMALGVGELGNSQVFVKVIDVSGGAGAAATAVSAAKARGSTLLVSYASPAVTSAIASLPADQRPPLVNLGAPVPAGAGNVYNLVSDEVDSAIEGARAAAASGHKKVMAFAQADFTPASENRLSSAIRASGGTWVGIARYELTDASASDAVQKSRGLLQGADTVLILGKSAIVTTVAGAAKAGGQPNLSFVGTSAWPQQTWSNASVNGTLIARVEPDGAGMIGARYKLHYKRTLTDDAAYGYDAVAIASGIVRTKGPEAMTSETLTSKVGFHGVTGVFRLTPGGSVERKLSLYAISGGKLNLLGAASASF